LTIASVREALGITLGQIGNKIGSSWQAVQQLEKAEATDRITPGALRRTAEAMGCELVYALVPESGTMISVFWIYSVFARFAPVLVTIW
jgi:transcriptional regulator with XRE-family HTH domain